jgi:salicylate hydroxylase
MGRVTVAGGGIAGLAAALAVARAGHDVTVLERRSEFTELGAGIQLAPNAFRALDRLGVETQVRADAVYVERLRLMDGVTGDTIAQLPLDASFRDRFGHPYAVVHRNDLYAPLLDACRREPRVTLCTDAAVTGYRRHGDLVEVSLATGTTVSCDALIGADGLHSTVRQRIVGDGAPRISGHTIYRSVIPIERVPESLRWHSVTLWAADHRHVVHYPIAGGRVFNLAATVDDRAGEVVAGVPVDRAEVLRTFDGLCEVPRQLLELGSDWRRWVLCDRDPVSDWTDGPVVLLGDAAHPMLQYAAQGACMALEDAVSLGGLLRSDGDFATVFTRFNKERADRTGRLQLISRRMGEEVYHPTGAQAAARTAWLAGLSTEDMFAELDWLYGDHTREYAHAD